MQLSDITDLTNTNILYVRQVERKLQKNVAPLIYQAWCDRVFGDPARPWPSVNTHEVRLLPQKGDRLHLPDAF